MKCKNGSRSFFRNAGCESFPCHEIGDPDNFNCMFCFCPLYAFGDKCGGNFSYTPRGVKNCINCAIPHERRNYDHILGKVREFYGFNK